MNVKTLISPGDVFISPFKLSYVHDHYWTSTCQKFFKRCQYRWPSKFHKLSNSYNQDPNYQTLVSVHIWVDGSLVSVNIIGNSVLMDGVS